MNESTGGNYYSVGRAAVAAERSVRTIERWIASGLLPVTWLGKTRYVSESDLKKALRQSILANPSKRRATLS